MSDQAELRDLEELFRAHGETDAGEPTVFLPAVGYRGPFELAPRYAGRWRRLLDALHAARIDRRDWPYRFESAVGRAEAGWWHLKWGYHGEGAVLKALEHRWHAERDRGETAEQLSAVLRPLMVALWRKEERPSQRAVAEQLGYRDLRPLERRLGRHPGLWDRLKTETRAEAQEPAGQSPS